MKMSRDNAGLVVMLALLIPLLVLVDHLGLSHKWFTAIGGTLVPFSVVAMSTPWRWRKWSFWVSFTICLIVHSLFLWSLFHYFFANVYPHWIFWSLIAFVDTFVMWTLVVRLDRALAGKRQTLHAGAGSRQALR